MSHHNSDHDKSVTENEVGILTLIFLHCIYFRVEDRSDQFMQKIRRYANVLAKNDDSNKNEGCESNDMAHDPTNTKSMQSDSSNGNRKSVLCWQIIRQSLLGLEMENTEQLSAQEMKPV